MEEDLQEEHLRRRLRINEGPWQRCGARCRDFARGSLDLVGGLRQGHPMGSLSFHVSSTPSCAVL